MLSIHNLVYQVQKVKESQKDSFKIEVPELSWDGKGVLALVGSNGSGKSTLLSLIAGLKKPLTGTCSFCGFNTFFSYDRIKLDLPLVTWDIPLNGQLRPRAYLDLLRSVVPRWDYDLAERLLEEFTIPANQEIASFSKGEHAKLKLLLASAMRPKVLLIDELTNDLDEESRKKIFNFLDEQVFEGQVGIVWATNILSDVERYANSLVILSKGQLVAQDNIDDFKSRHKKIALRSGGIGANNDLGFLQGERLSWDGKNGLLYTKKFNTDMQQKLTDEGLEFSLLPYSLAEIVNEYGVLS